MASLKLPMVIRDPIHDVIPFKKDDQDHLLLSLVNTREFQRLRRIKQLGLAELVFPAANHSRFAHSIGVMHNARRFVQAIVANGAPLDAEQQMAVAAAALLHDIGHGPFSHAFEAITGDKHEARTREIILSEETEVNERLRDVDPKLPARIANFFDVEDEEVEEPQQAQEDNDIPPFASQIVSSQLDADRTDFLLRDSYATGTDYGQFDLNWLIRSLKYIDGKVVVGRKGQSSVEQYIFARRNMYLRCYFHKTCRAAEVMLKHVFERFKDLVGERGLKSAAELIGNVNPIMLSAFGNQEKVPLEDYLELDDCSATEFVRACSTGKDPTLEYLGKGLLNRQLYKVVDATDVKPERFSDFGIKIHEVVERAGNKLPTGFPEKFVCKVHTIKDTPYKPYSPDDAPHSQIFVETVEGGVSELNRVSPRVGELAKEERLICYTFPAALDSDIRPIEKAVLKKGE